MVPTYERFEARQQLRPCLDQRLVIDLKLPFGERATQVGVQPVAMLQLFVHFRLEETPFAATTRLGTIERNIGVTEQPVDRGTCCVGQRDPDADTYLDPLADDLERDPDGRQQPVGQRHLLTRLRRAHLNDGKLVTPEPRDQVGFTRVLSQDSRDPTQQLVPGGVAVHVVHRLEPIEIEIQHGDVVAPTHARQDTLHVLAEQHAVRQVGEGVVPRHVAKLVLRASTFRNILVGSDPPLARDRPARFLYHPPVRQLVHRLIMALQAVRIARRESASHA